MGDLGLPELFIVLALVIVVLGPGKLAGVGAALGTAIREFRQAVRERDDHNAPTPPR
mgnify:CR=1 FL=1